MKKENSLGKRIERVVRRIRKVILPTNRLVPAIEVPFPIGEAVSTLGNGDFAKVAVLIHIYYVDLTESLISLLDHIPFSFVIYISTDSREKASAIKHILDRLGKYVYEIRVFPNRGRDVAPKIVGYSDVYFKHEYFLHLHSKKSFHDASGGDAWREYLCHTLVGSREIVDSIFKIFSYPEIGIIYPRHKSKHEAKRKWSGNFPNTFDLLQKMGIKISPSDRLDFPAGSMYWGRSAALKPLLDLNLTIEDFQEEAGQGDGTLAHAIERSINFAAKKAGYSSQQIVPSGHHIEGLNFVKLAGEQDLPRAFKLCRKMEKNPRLP